MPWGMALKAAFEKKASLWDHKASLLIKRPRQEAPNREHETKGKGKKGGKQEQAAPALINVKKEDGKGKDIEAKRTWVTSRYDRNNQVICKKYNDARGCSSTCPQGLRH